MSLAPLFNGYFPKVGHDRDNSVTATHRAPEALLCDKLYGLNALRQSSLPAITRD